MLFLLLSVRVFSCFARVKGFFAFKLFNEKENPHSFSNFLLSVQCLLWSLSAFFFLNGRSFFPDPRYLAVCELLLCCTCYLFEFHDSMVFKCAPHSFAIFQCDFGLIFKGHG